MSDLDTLASERMESGIALLHSGAPDAVRGAIRCFEEAINLRQRLPLAENPGYRYGLAGGWINRGDALARLGAAGDLSAAVNSYARAIELLKDAPATDDGLFVKRLAIAWLNRGLALEAQAGEPALAEAACSFEAAVSVLTRSRRMGGASHDLVFASAWTNLGNTLLRSAGTGSATRAAEAARNALLLLAPSESKELAAAEAGLKARHVLCQALTALLAEGSRDESMEMDFIGRVTDTAEDALGLAQVWEEAGETRFRPLAAQFFHLSALVYEKHQPHFLAEFLLEHLDPERATCFRPFDENWLAIGRESLLRARRGFANRDFAWLATPEGIRQIQTLKDLNAAEARLKIVAEMR